MSNVLGAVAQGYKCALSQLLSSGQDLFSEAGAPRVKASSTGAAVCPRQSCHKGIKMNTKLFLAVPLDLGEGRTRVRLPAGFPIVVDRSMQIVKPILVYLYACFVKLHVKEVPNTWEAYAQDLRTWWDFLEYRKIDWRDATSADFDVYVIGLKQSINPISGQHYAEATIIRRCNTVIYFYNHAWRENWVSKDLKLASTSPSKNYLGDLLEKSNDDDHIRKALFPKEFRAIAEELGAEVPLIGNAAKPCRDRLWAELMVLTGMRPAQPESIKIQEILNLDPIEPENDSGVTYLTITVKGHKRRRIRIPNLLLRKLHWYIENERKEAVEEGERRGHFKPGSVNSLFVNGLEAKHNIGFPARYATFHAAFTKAARRAHDRGFLKNYLMVVEVEDPESGELIQKNVLKVPPHVLRHTFTVWNISGEKKAGNSEPYKNTSGLLGHKNLATTINIYSKAVGEFEAMINDRVASSLTKLIQGDDL